MYHNKDISIYVCNNVETDTRVDQVRLCSKYYVTQQLADLLYFPDRTQNIIVEG